MIPTFVVQARILVEDGLAFVNIPLAFPTAAGKHHHLTQFKAPSTSRTPLCTKGIQLFQIYENLLFLCGFHVLTPLNFLDPSLVASDKTFVGSSA
jgi:hypothetical protein